MLSDYIAGIQLLSLQDEKLDDLRTFSLIFDPILKSSSDNDKTQMLFRIVSKNISGSIGDSSQLPTELPNILNYGSKSRFIFLQSFSEFDHCHYQ